MIIYSPTFTGSVQITGSQTVTGDLTVQGNLTAQTFILSSSVSYFTESFASGSTRFGDSVDDNMIMTGSFKVSGSTGGGFIITGSTGYVGIGTSTPDFPLVVKTNASANSLKILGRSSGDTSISWNSSDNATQYAHIDVGAAYFQIHTSNSQAIEFYTSGSERMRITAAGNVGIGTSSTVGKLDISTGGNRNVVISNDSTDTGYNIVSLNGSRTKGSYAGIAGGGTADNNLYLNSGVDIVFQTGASFTQRMRTLSDFTLAGSGAGTGGPTQVIGTTAMVGILFVSIGTQSCAAIFIINAGSAPVLVSQTTAETRFSITNDNGNTANVYVSGTDIVLRNNIQATRTFYCQFFGKLI